MLFCVLAAVTAVTVTGLSVDVCGPCCDGVTMCGVHTNDSTVNGVFIAAGTPLVCHKRDYNADFRGGYGGRCLPNLGVDPSTFCEPLLPGGSLGVALTDTVYVPGRVRVLCLAAVPVSGSFPLAPLQPLFDPLPIFFYWLTTDQASVCVQAPMSPPTTADPVATAQPCVTTVYSATRRWTELAGGVCQQTLPTRPGARSTRGRC